MLAAINDRNSPTSPAQTEQACPRDIFNDIFRPTCKDGTDALELDGLLFTTELCSLQDPLTRAFPSDGVVPSIGLSDCSMVRSGSSGSSGASTQAHVPSYLSPPASSVPTHIVNADLLAYFSYPTTPPSQAPNAGTSSSAWQLMPMMPLSHPPPPYKPQWTSTPVPLQRASQYLSTAKHNAHGTTVKTEADAADAAFMQNAGAEALGQQVVPEHPSLPGGFLRMCRPADRKLCVQRYQEKRKRRSFEKTIRYQSRKAYAEVRPRIKGRFATRKEVIAMKAAAAAGIPYDAGDDDDDADADDDDCDNYTDDA